MTIKRFIQEYKKEISWSKSPTLDLEILLTHVLKKDKTFLYTNPNFEIPKEKQKKLLIFVKQRKNHMPIAYIINTKDFYNYSFYVNKNVLIPRPETEILVELAIDYIKQNRTQTEFSVLEIGTGSGCIILTIAKELQKTKVISGEIKWTAGDISLKALEITRKNYKTLFPKQEIKINFINTNLFEKINKKQDIIIANLPYVPQKEWENLKPNVKDYEPQGALIGGENGFELIEELLKQSTEFIKSNGAIFLEIHHNQKIFIKDISKKLFPKATLKIQKDYSRKDRFAIITNI